MVQAWWQKLNANERMAAQGAVIVFVIALLGTNVIALLGAAGVLAVYWLKYSPNQIAWPAPVELINVVISGILGLIAVFAIFGLLFAMGIGGIGFGMLGLGGGLFGGGILLIGLVAVIAFVAGVGMMFLGTWREYQALQAKAAPPQSPSTSPPPPPPAAPPTAPPSAPAAPPSEPPSA